jgi:hypothetical protein
MAEPTEAVEEAEPILRVRGIGQRFGSVEVEEVDLEIPASGARSWARTGR